MLSRRDRAIEVSGPATFHRPDSQLVSAGQIYEDSFKSWALNFYHSVVLDRKTWEYCYIAQAIESYCGFLGKRGLCFGAGKELLPALFAARGAEIVATDRIEQNHDWQTTKKEDLFHAHLIDRETFDRSVSFMEADMNEIPASLNGFDFLWSTGSLEHIGSHENGLRFIENAMACLAPGGIAVHTTEFTVSSPTKGQDHPELSFYCQEDIRALAKRLIANGHLIVLNFERGDTPADNHVDVTPYHKGRTLLAHFETHVITSIGVIIQKDGIAGSANAV